MQVKDRKEGLAKHPEYVWKNGAPAVLQMFLAITFQLVPSRCQDAGDAVMSSDTGKRKDTAVQGFHEVQPCHA